MKIRNCRTNICGERRTRSLFIHPMSEMYVGLHNVGCSCHMNAVVQQLYHLPKFKERLLACDINAISSTRINRHIQSIVIILHRLFGGINSVVMSDGGVEGKVIPLSDSLVFDPTSYYKQYLLHHYIHERENGNPNVPMLEESEITHNDEILSAILEEEEKNSYYFINEVLKYLNTAQSVDDLVKISVTNTITIYNSEEQVPSVVEHQTAPTTIYSISDSMYMISLDILNKNNIVEALDDYFAEKSVANNDHSTHGNSSPFTPDTPH